MRPLATRRALLLAMPLAVSGPLALAAAPDPQKSGGIEEIVVHANKRSEKAQKVPVSITALSGRTLQTTGVRDALSLARDIPSLAAETTSGSTNPRYRLRGIGTNDFSANLNPAVGVSEDDVFLDSGASQGVPIYDLDHVEVLRGPQGTLQGKNTTAGAVDYYTKRPTDQLGGYIRGTAGDDGLVGEEGAVGGPIVGDKVMGRLSFVDQRYDGQYHDDARNESVNGYQYYDVRGQLLFNPIDALTILLKAHVGRNRTDVSLSHVGVLAGGSDAQDYVQPSGRNVLENNGRGDATTRRSGVSVNTTYRLPSDWSLTDVFALEWNHFNVFSDDDASPAPLNYEENIGGVARVMSNELRIASPQSQPLRFIGGLYYLRNKTLSFSQQPLYSPVDFGVGGNAYDINVNSESAAIFSSVAYDLTKRLTLSVGGRFTSETRSANGQAWAYATNPADPFNTSNHVLTYVDTNSGTYIDTATGLAGRGPGLSRTFNRDSEDASLTYKIDTRSIAYVRFARGFRSGNYNTYVTTAQDFSLYDPETLTDYEGGIKTRLWDNRLQLDLSAFHYDYDNLQVTILQNTGSSTTNAASAVSNGFELEAQLRPIDDLFTSFSVAYQDAHYTDFPNASGPTPINRGNPINLTGAPLERAPKVTANVLVSYHIPVSFGSFDLQTDWRYTSRYRFQAWSDATNVTPAAFLASSATQNLIHDAFSQGDLVTGNVRVAYRTPDQKNELAFWVHNVTNQRYYTNAFGEFFNRSITRYPGLLRSFGAEATRTF